MPEEISIMQLKDKMLEEYTNKKREEIQLVIPEEQRKVQHQRWHAVAGGLQCRCVQRQAQQQAPVWGRAGGVGRGVHLPAHLSYPMRKPMPLRHTFWGQFSPALSLVDML
jgi:hypothetical protein